MIEQNLYGSNCVKCEVWVNPYCGLAFISPSNTLCDKCKDIFLRKLSEWFNKMMETSEE